MVFVVIVSIFSSEGWNENSLSGFTTVDIITAGKGMLNGSARHGIRGNKPDVLYANQRSYCVPRWLTKSDTMKTTKSLTP